MIYNPIFEEEIESKTQLKQLKKEIKTRARNDNMKEAIGRVYNMLQKKPMITITSIFHPILNLFKITKTKEV